MAAGGSRTIKIRFTGDSKGVDRAAKNVEKTLKSLGNNAGNALGNLGNAVTSTLSSGGTYGALAIVAAIVAAAPAAAAALSAIIPLAFGGGILAAGIIAVSKTPAVKNAFAGLRAQMFDKNTSEIENGIKAAQERYAKAAALGSASGMKSAKYDMKKLQDELDEAMAFNKANKSFKDMFASFEGPVVRAIEVFGETFKKMTPSIERMAEAMAPIIDKLAPAFSDMAFNSLPGMEKLVKSSAPFFEIIADKAPELGTAIGDFMDKITEGGPGAQQFLEDVMDFLIWIIPKVGTALAWLSARYVNWRNGLLGVVNGARNAWNGFYNFFAGIGKRIGSVIGNAIVAFNRFRSNVAGVWTSIVGTISSAVRRIEGWWNRLKNLASSAINFSIGGFNIPGISGGRAVGGPVGAGRSYLVGEKGPEILTMGSQSGNITPNHKLGGGGGPEVLNLTLDISEGIQQVIQINLRNHDRQMKRSVTARRGMAY